MQKNIGLDSTLFSPSMISKAAARVTTSAMAKNKAQKEMMKAAKGKTENQLMHDPEFVELSKTYVLARDNFIQAEAAHSGVMAAR